MTATAEKTDKTTKKDTNGRVVRVTGPVVDVEFPRGSVPELFNALHAEITFEELAKTLTLEVAQHLGDSLVRCISMQPTDGLVRGVEVVDTGRLDLGAGRRRREGPRVQRAGRSASTSRATGKTSTAGRSTASRRPSTSSNPAPRCWRPASRSSTC